MWTWECSKHKVSGIRWTLIYTHARILLIFLSYIHDVWKIKSRLNTHWNHIHRKSHDVNITCTLSVSKECSLNSVRSCKNTKLSIRYAASTVIVRVYTEHNILAVLHIAAQIFNLWREYMRHRNLNSCRYIDDCFIVCWRLPYIKNRIADLKCIVNLCSRKALRWIFKCKIAVCLCRKLL